MRLMHETASREGASGEVSVIVFGSGQIESAIRPWSSLQREELSMATLSTDAPITPLRQRMQQDILIRGLEPHTQQDYVRHVRRFAAFLGRSPDTGTPEEIRRFQLTTMRPPQHGHGGRTSAGSSGVSSSEGGATFSSSRASARLALRASPATTLYVVFAPGGDVRGDKSRHLGGLQSEGCVTFCWCLHVLVLL